MVEVTVREARVLWITFDDPPSMNAFDAEAMAMLSDAWARLREDDALRVAVVRGAGDRAFSVGSNLKTFIPRLQSGELSPRANEGAYLKGPSGPVDKPIVAAVNGACLGGGLEQLLLTDVRLAVPHAIFGLPEPTWGLFPGGGGVARLVQQLPHAWAMELLLTGAPVSAEQALRMGLINRIVEPHALDDAAMAVARTIAGNGPLAIRRIKQAAREAATLELERALALESELGDAVFRSDQAAEGLAAFAEKREPAFRLA